MKRCSAFVVLLAPTLEKCVTDKIAARVRSAMALSGSRTPRTSLFLWLSVFPKYDETGSITTNMTLPTSAIFLSRISRSVCRLRARRAMVPVRTAETTCTRLRSAPAPIKRGTMVSAAPSSALKMMALPTGARPSLHGQRPPVVTAAMIDIQTWLLPVPGSPAMQVCFPRASRPDQSHSTLSGAMSAAQWETRAGAALSAPLPWRGFSLFDPVSGCTLVTFTFPSRRGSGGGKSVSGGTFIGPARATRRQGRRRRAVRPSTLPVRP